MVFIADLHIHSHFSRATSRNLDPENLDLWAQKKGISVVGTGDFTHPGWVEELKEKLVPAESGLYRLKPELEKMVKKDLPEACRNPARFLLSGEISCIYKRGGKTRKVHNLILMPDFESVERLNRALDRIGNITSDGRPILGLDSRNLLDMALEAGDNAFFIPAHIWTPWFSLFGSKSGFDTIEECFGDLTPHIYALETGLSSDPPMNRLLSCLDRYLLVSNSDAHSPAKLGREANIFDTELDYPHMIDAMTRQKGFTGTIEFYPQEGKYHFDGHRKCRVSLHPMETEKYKGTCPSCGKPLTVGVLHRVSELADREQPEILKDFFSLIPLPEILSEILGCGPATKKVGAAYESLLSSLGPEIKILMDCPLRDIEKAGGLLTAEAINRMRKGEVLRQEGYDGKYGAIKLFQENEKQELAGQKSLFEVKKNRLPTRSPIPAKALKQEKKEKTAPINKKPFSDPILDPLNTVQREAVLYEGGHLLIVAGPGTGKTMTLTHRIAYLVRTNIVDPDQVLALTFTNKAAEEMRGRIDLLLPEGLSRNIRVNTFHGFCLEVLRNEGERLNLPPDFKVCPEQDTVALLGKVVSESGKGRSFASRIQKNLYDMKKLSVLEKGDVEEYQELFPVFNAYNKRLRSSNMLDIDDLEIEALRLFRDFPRICRKYSGEFLRIFVDEYQDTNPMQSALLKMLVKEGINHICAIGDPDQAIYGFRGSDVKNFFRFMDDFPGAGRISLVKNYRSTRIILGGASALMERNDPLECSSGNGGPILTTACTIPAEEAEMVVEQIEKLMGGTTYFSLDSGRVSSHEDGEDDDLGFGDIAVLYRLNSQGDEFEEALTRAGIPFIRSGEKPLTEKYPVNIIWRFLQALHYPDREYYLGLYLYLIKKKHLDGMEVLRACKQVDSLGELIDRAVSLHGFDLSSEESEDAVRRLRDISGNIKGDLSSFLDQLSLDRAIDHTVFSGDRVSLMSLHAAKGLEWPVVFITGCEDRLIPCNLFGDNDKAEEKRLFYVGMTRACRRLIISHAKRRKLNGRMLDMKPSPFLSLVPGEFFSPLERGKWKQKRKEYKQLDLFKL